MFDDTRGGNDTLTGGGEYGPTDALTATPATMDGNARGGDDTLTGGGGRNFVYGDAVSMGGNARGGDDTLIGAAMRSSTLLDWRRRLPWTATPAAATTR